MSDRRTLVSLILHPWCSPISKLIVIHLSRNGRCPSVSCNACLIVAMSAKAIQYWLVAADDHRPTENETSTMFWDHIASTYRSFRRNLLRRLHKRERMVRAHEVTLRTYEGPGEEVPVPPTCDTLALAYVLWRLFWERIRFIGITEKLAGLAEAIDDRISHLFIVPSADPQGLADGDCIGVNRATYHRFLLNALERSFLECAAIALPIREIRIRMIGLKTTSRSRPLVSSRRFPDAVLVRNFYGIAAAFRSRLFFSRLSSWAMGSLVLTPSTRLMMTLANRLIRSSTSRRWALSTSMSTVSASSQCASWIRTGCLGLQ